MTRNEIAKHLNVEPWDVDEWLLRGCPADRFLSQWNFELSAVKRWLKENRIKLKRNEKSKPALPRFDHVWLRSRCPKCAEQGFKGEKAGLLCTLGELVMGRWYLRRVGYPCGHSMEILN